MSKVYEFNGITKEDAIKNAEEELNVDKEALDITVVNSSKGKTMFSILDKNRVTIEVRIIEDKLKNNKFDKDHVDKAKENVQEFLDDLRNDYSDINLQYDVYEDGRKIYVEIDNDQNAKWIGYQGKILDSMQKVLQEVGTSDFNTNVRVYLNIGNYKEERQKSLYNISDNIIAKVEKTNTKASLKPMNSYERKLVHDYINEKGYETYSVGEEPKRHIIVKPKD